ncbi:hypothetical protein [Bacterioplanoides sp. SCSIO 12839]|uniref:hypothetical protein n=1 Tax=Bacterioplanoides sp. SCSIO 12839 TaxID=2829569 RepID=UPI00210229D5|nr:hypothetical protein [Bacterioplanoides sp. SCSIO 12839]UTW49284.1 hypothetical protein KFF03_05105 [Bacterioplanoides sp. SCSIO 12839]
MLVWSLSAKCLPEKYYLPPIKMTSVCVVLSLVTAYAINFELEGGGISILMAILFLSTIWSVILLPTSLVFKFIIERFFHEKTHNKPLKYVPTTKSVASTGLANARRLAGRYMASER